MDDLMGKLSEVLNDPQSMQQISQLASAITKQNTDLPPANAPAENGFEGFDGSNGSPDISAMLSSLFSGAQGNEASAVGAEKSAGGGIVGNANNSNNSNSSNNVPDISKIMKITNLISGSAAEDKNIALLLAMKPLLKEENQVKIDRLVKIFKIMNAYPLIRDSGLLGGDIFG
jgi:hypothetical protein